MTEMEVIKRESTSAAVEGFHKRYLLENGAMRASLMNVQRGTDIVRHSHAHSSELFYIVSGGCTLSAGGQEARLSAGDIAIVPAGEPHYFRIDRDADLVLLAVVAPNLDDAMLHANPSNAAGTGS